MGLGGAAAFGMSLAAGVAGVQMDPDPKKGAGAAQPGIPMVKLGGSTWTVGKGENLWVIAEQAYNHGRFWKAIRDANQDKVRDGGNLIYAGTVLVLPELEIPALRALEDADSWNDVIVLDILARLSDDEYTRFLAGLTAAQKKDEAALIQRIEIMQSTGMTFEELAAEQRAWMEVQAKAEGKTIGEYLQGKAKKHGYGGKEPTQWLGFTKKEKKRWEQRFRACVKKVKKTAPEDIKALIRDAEKKGGGFKWDPKGCEEMGGFAYNDGASALGVGTSWVVAVEKDAKATFGNVAHELGGHGEYGRDNQSWGIISEVLDGLPADEQAKARSDGNSLYSTYGYMETEVFAELREQEYVVQNNPTDKPVNDVPKQLRKMKELFTPKLAEALVRGLWRRVQASSSITPEAVELFKKSVKDVFSIGL